MATADDGELPVLRIYRAWDAAEKAGAANGVERGVALDIAQAAVAVIGEGTRRWGRLCIQCRSLLVSRGGILGCPEHGAPADAAVLLISFEPLGGQR